MIKSALKQFLFYGIGSIGAAVFSFMAVFMLTRMVSPSLYGQGRLFVVFVSFLFMVCNCGLDQSFVRFYYVSKSQNDRNVLFKKCLLLVIGFSFLVALLCFAFSNLLHLLFKGLFAHFILYLIIALVFTVTNRFLLLIFRMEQKPFIYAVGQISNTMLYCVGIWVLYYIYHISDVRLVVLPYIFGLLASSVTLFCLKLIFYNKTSLIEGSKHQYLADYKMWNLLKYGSPMVFTFMLTWCFQSLDRFLLLRFSNYHELGIYSAAFSLIAPIVMIQTIFTTLWTPISVKRMEGNSDGMGAFYASIFSGIVVGMLCCMMLFLSVKDFVIHFLGIQYQQASYLLPWLLFIPFFYILSEVATVGIIKSKKSYLNIYVALITIVVNVILCTILIRKWGALGAAIAIAITYAVFFCSRLIISFSQFKFKINYWKFILSLTILVCTIAVASHYLYILSVINLLMFLVLYLKEIKQLYVSFKYEGLTGSVNNG